jgi:hypothetical protein
VLYGRFNRFFFFFPQLLTMSLVALLSLVQAACHCMAELLGKIDPEVCDFSYLDLVKLSTFSVGVAL